jgi:predicted ATPase
MGPARAVDAVLRELIHVPALRGNPERSYPTANVGKRYPGTFEAYTASVIANWGKTGREEKRKSLDKQLADLQLTWGVTVRRIDDTQVELQVGRLRERAEKIDFINIADVGFGVSQVLPVLVALLVAEPGQLVYVEQPEVHLHPRAQFAMASVLAHAASRGVKVVAETHSSLLILGVQSLVAEGKLDPQKVKLHWFQRDDKGKTTITSADLDETGAFGDWPEDFAQVDLEAESRYLDAAERKKKKTNAPKKVKTPRR